MDIIFPILKFIISFLLIALTAIIFILILKGLNFRTKIRIREGMNVPKKKDDVSDAQYTEIMRHREISRGKWEKILEKIKSGDERDLNLAIIKADSLIDDILCLHGCPGNDMGERLKSLNRDDYKHLDDLWEAHKVRNRLAHEPDYHINKDEAKKVINLYHVALEELLSKELESV